MLIIWNNILVIETFTTIPKKKENEKKNQNYEENVF